MELTLFVIVGAIAVISAAMMLISENAVYSALFLILNFACIAFFFLMLNAPFLAMVQVTVYTGAIMVLFLFVIMLLGAERVMPEERPRFRWLAPAVIVLALAFLLVAGITIIDGEIDLVEPEKAEPYARVVHALDSASSEKISIDLYLGDERVAHDLAFGESTDFERWEEGRYEAQLFSAGANPATDEPLAVQQVEVNAGEALSLVAVGRVGQPGVAVVVATEEVAYNEDTDAARVIAVNGLPDRPAVDVLNDSLAKEALVDGLSYGQASAMFEIDKGTYTIGLYPDGDDRTRLAVLKDEELEPNTSVLWVFTEERKPDNSFVDAIVNLETEARPSFGGPTHIGQLLYTRYVLPFEMVALLLLVAMVGAIVLTHETLAPRRRMVRRLANPPAGLEQPIVGESGK
jgi:NADH:ubiquinone oxidoreductase subunit 6 (subunit J)